MKQRHTLSRTDKRHGPCQIGRRSTSSPAMPNQAADKRQVQVLAQFPVGSVSAAACRTIMARDSRVPGLIARSEWEHGSGCEASEPDGGERGGTGPRAVLAGGTQITVHQCMCELEPRVSECVCVCG